MVGTSPFNKLILGDEFVQTKRGNVEIPIPLADLAMFAAGLRHPGYTPGRFYPLTDGNTGASITGTHAIGTIYYYPFLVEEPINIAAFSFWPTGTVPASSFYKVAVYANGRSTVTTAGAPRYVPLGAPIFSTPTTTVTMTTVTAAPSLAPTPTGMLAPGLYWVAAKFSTAVIGQLIHSSTLTTRLMGSSTAAAALTTQVRGFTITGDTYANAFATLAASQAFIEVTSGTMPMLAMQLATTNPGF